MHPVSFSTLIEDCKSSAELVVVTPWRESTCDHTPSKVREEITPGVSHTKRHVRCEWRDVVDTRA